ncbi:ABC transporter substrate-binding protein [Amycolatopsis sp. NPDC059235]|uniref:ABC transporter substrate-binding protein n=1 Tax=Amycolatopsis sp. NPDC059235 TaxID=3346782 RepID=UPI00366E9C2D
MLSRRRVLGGFAATAALAALSACGGGERGSGSGGVLTIAYPEQPNSLDPAKANQAYAIFLQAAYASLINRRPDGSLAPGLATSWRYVGEGNRKFELTLREGVRFSDGELLTADGVKKHFDYLISAAGPQANALTGAVATVTGPSTVVLDLKEPNPVVPDMLTNEAPLGSVISPKGLAAPAQLVTVSAGAGPYQLDPAQTLAGDRYTYVPNPHYSGPGTRHYEKVVIKIMANPNAAMNALRARQVDVVVGQYASVPSAKEARMQIKHTPVVFLGLILSDRDGVKLPPLKDLRVRQAINFAIDRESVARALVGEYGVATEQTVLPGTDGYVPENKDFYRYDPERAKQLLREAGYGAGFTMPVLTTTFANTMSEVLSDQLGKVGIKLDLHNVDGNAYFRDLAAGTYPAVSVGYGGQSIWLEGKGLFGPDALFNGMRTHSPELTSLYERAAGADPETRAGLDRQIEDFLVKQAWFAPVLFTPVFYFAQPEVNGIELSPRAPLPSLLDWHPAK